MRFRTLVAAGLGAGLVAAPALADDGYRHGRVRFTEPGVTLQRATEASAEEAIDNLPFLPGDRVWTDAAGRAEFQFPDGTVVRLDCRSKLDYAGHEEGEGERIALRIWSGSAIVRVRTTDFAHFEIETPAGMVQALDRAIVRVDVEAGETRVSVHAGEAELNDGRRPVRLAAGERTFARWGAEPEEPRRFDPDEGDDFTRWDDQRESEEREPVRSAEYLPGELAPYAGEIETNGVWRHEDTAGYVWVPRVEVGWQPYSNGQWAWTPYGWTWVPNERWGWAPFHYGRWDFSDSLGWYWMPGRSWGPGWVSWAVGGGYVGWCPLGRHDRPVTAWGLYRGATGGWGRYGRHDPWTVVRQGDMGGRDLFRRRVAATRVDPGAFRVADAIGLRPTHDARSLRDDGGSPRAISRKMSPGDFVRELGVDNKTTIPAPWTHGYGPPPAGVEGARTGAQPRSDPGSEDKPSRGWTTNRGTGAATAPTSGAASGSGRGSEEREASGQASRTAPRSTPTQKDAAPAGGRSGGVERGEGSAPPSDGARRRSGDEGSSGYRPRGNGGESSGANHPRGSGGESSGSGARPRSNGGSKTHTDSGGASKGGGGSKSAGASKGSGSSSSGSGKATAHPRGDRN